MVVRHVVSIICLVSCTECLEDHSISFPLFHERIIFCSCGAWSRSFFRKLWQLGSSMIILQDSIAQLFPMALNSSEKLRGLMNPGPNVVSSYRKNTVLVPLNCCSYDYVPLFFKPKGERNRGNFDTQFACVSRPFKRDRKGDFAFLRLKFDHFRACRIG